MSGRDERPRKQRPVCSYCGDNNVDMWVRLGSDLFWINKADEKYANGKALTLQKTSETLTHSFSIGKAFTFGCCRGRCNDLKFSNILKEETLSYIKLCFKTGDYIMFDDWAKVKKEMNEGD